MPGSGVATVRLDVAVRSGVGRRDAAAVVAELFKHYLYMRNQSPCLVDELQA
eukprot:jgi/Tetstr1/446704/TSEL_034193.t1